MPIYSPTGFLDITNATLRTSNIITSNLHFRGSSNVFVTTHNEYEKTLEFTHPTTAFTTVGNVEVGGTITMGNIAVEALHSLEAVTAVGNTTPLTVEFSNANTGIVTTGNVEVGKDLTVSSDLTVSGNVEVAKEVTVSSDLTVSGNVGIGTTSPSSRLHVGDGSNPPAGTVDADASLTLNGAGRKKVEQSKPGIYHRENVGLGLHSDYKMSFEVGGSSTLVEAMRINNDGNVGIGITNPSAKLQVQGDLYVSSPKIENLFYAPPNWGYTDSSNYETNFWSFTYNAPADGYLILNLNAHYNYPYANQSFYAWISVDDKTNDNSTLYDSTTAGAAAGDGGHFHEYNDTDVSWKDINHSTSAYVSAGNHTISLRFQKFTNTYSLSINGAAIKLLFIPKNYM